MLQIVAPDVLPMRPRFALEHRRLEEFLADLPLEQEE
jgi:hypothetical protein